MKSIAKKVTVVLAIVASSACKSSDPTEAEGTSGEGAHKESREGKDEKHDKKDRGKEHAKDRGRAHAKEREKSEDEPVDEDDDPPPKHASTKESSKEGKESKEAKGDDDRKEPRERRLPGDEPGDGRKYDVPFIEGHRDPLALTRGFLRDALADNARYMQKHDAGFFHDFAFAQTPRATVITCSDSRVQSTAFDATAENDDFFIRNIGNQIANSEGSVEYGIHHLHTPVLFVLGHTGCGAVKAAMGDFSKESEAIAHELSSLHLPPKKEGQKDDDPRAWLDAVVDNINDQVSLALTKFDEDLSHGALTIVGAVYDFRNDLKQGPGKIAIVNVNGVTDQAKLREFVRSVGGTVPEEEPAKTAAQSPDAPALTSLSELRAALAHIPARAAAGAASEIMNATDTAEAKPSPPPPAPKPAPRPPPPPAKDAPKDTPKEAPKEASLAKDAPKEILKDVPQPKEE